MLMHFAQTLTEVMSVGVREVLLEMVEHVQVSTKFGACRRLKVVMYLDVWEGLLDTVECVSEAKVSHLILVEEKSDKAALTIPVYIWLPFLSPCPYVLFSTSLVKNSS